MNVIVLSPSFIIKLKNVEKFQRKLLTMQNYVYIIANVRCNDVISEVKIFRYIYFQFLFELLIA